jgi:hypothetical protein
MHGFLMDGTTNLKIKNDLLLCGFLNGGRTNLFDFHSVLHLPLMNGRTNPTIQYSISSLIDGKTNAKIKIQMIEFCMGFLIAGRTNPTINFSVGSLTNVKTNPRIQFSCLLNGLRTHSRIQLSMKD